MAKSWTLTRWQSVSLKCGLLLFVFVASVFPLRASTISLAEYHKNLQRVITAIDSLGQIDEDESAESYQRRLTETIAGIRNILPENQSIESAGSVSSVDNGGLYKQLHELETSSAQNRETIRLELLESLKAIDERIEELEKAHASHQLSKTQANQKLAEILARSEYESKTQQGSALWRLLDRFIRWLSQFLPERSPLAPSSGSAFTKIAQVFVILLAAAVIFYVVLKLLRYFKGRSVKTAAKKRREPRIVLGEKLEPEASATDLLADAEALARAGEIRAAIRKAYIALLVELGDRKVISLAQYKTNRDYLRAVRGLPTLYTNMSGLTNSFERHWYGFAETAPADWQTFKAAYFAALQSSN